MALDVTHTMTDCDFHIVSSQGRPPFEESGKKKKRKKEKRKKNEEKMRKKKKKKEKIKNIVRIESTHQWLPPDQFLSSQTTFL